MTSETDEFDKLDKRFKLIKETVAKIKEEPELKILDQKIIDAFNKTASFYEQYFNNTRRFNQEFEEFDYEFLKDFVNFFKELDLLPETTLKVMLGDFSKSLYEGLNNKVVNLHQMMKEVQDNTKNTTSDFKQLINEFRQYKTEMNLKYEDLRNKFYGMINLTKKVMKENRELTNNLAQLLDKPLHCTPAEIIGPLSNNLRAAADKIDSIANKPVINEREQGLTEKLLSDFCLRLELGSNINRYLFDQFKDNRTEINKLITDLRKKKAIKASKLINSELMYEHVNQAFKLNLKPLSQLKDDIMNYLTTNKKVMYKDLYEAFPKIDNELVKKMVYSLKDDGKIETKQGRSYIKVV